MTQQCSPWFSHLRSYQTFSIFYGKIGLAGHSEACCCRNAYDNGSHPSTGQLKGLGRKGLKMRRDSAGRRLDIDWDENHLHISFPFKLQMAGRLGEIRANVAYFWAGAGETQLICKWKFHKTCQGDLELYRASWLQWQTGYSDTLDSS